jgi:hypothetical protein
VASADLGPGLEQHVLALALHQPGDAAHQRRLCGHAPGGAHPRTVDLRGEASDVDAGRHAPDPLGRDVRGQPLLGPVADRGQRGQAARRAADQVPEPHRGQARLESVRERHDRHAEVGPQRGGQLAQRPARPQHHHLGAVVTAEACSQASDARRGQHPAGGAHDVPAALTVEGRCLGVRSGAQDEGVPGMHAVEQVADELLDPPGPRRAGRW